MSTTPSFIGAFDSYEGIKSLKEGGMGKVWLGVSSKGKEVIIKEALHSSGGNDHLVERLRIEAKILKQLDHQNIVKYIDEKDEGNWFYLVIEKVNGNSIQERFLKVGTEETIAKQYIESLLHALKYLHDSSINVIHRDVKPDNILVDGMHLKLIDFGAGKQGFTQLIGQKQGTVIGTRGFTCPHQLSTPERVTTSCDLYAVGAVAFFLLTGRVPSQYTDMAGNLQTGPRQINSLLSPEINDFVLMAMQVDQHGHKYFGIVDEMLEYLKVGGIKFEPVSYSHLILGGQQYPINNSITVGRMHSCDSNCMQDGYKDLEVPVNDSKKFLSKHHFSIRHDGARYWIKDLHSLNGVAIWRRGRFFEIPNNGEEQLEDGDIIAISYNPTKGAYMTATFRKPEHE